MADIYVNALKDININYNYSNNNLLENERLEKNIISSFESFLNIIVLDLIKNNGKYSFNIKLKLNELNEFITSLYKYKNYYDCNLQSCDTIFNLDKYYYDDNIDDKKLKETINAIWNPIKNIKDEYSSVESYSSVDTYSSVDLYNKIPSTFKIHNKINRILWYDINCFKTFFIRHKDFIHSLLKIIKNNNTIENLHYVIDIFNY